MNIIKPLLQGVPWGGGDKTPVLDGAARGFVTVTGGSELNFPGSVNLSAPRVSRRASSAGFWAKKYLPLYLRRTGESFRPVFGKARFFWN
jgi:hypothetical protein